MEIIQCSLPLTNEHSLLSQDVSQSLIRQGSKHLENYETSNYDMLIPPGTRPHCNHKLVSRGCDWETRSPLTSLQRSLLLITYPDYLLCPFSLNPSLPVPRPWCFPSLPFLRPEIAGVLVVNVMVWPWHNCWCLFQSQGAEKSEPGTGMTQVRLPWMWAHHLCSTKHRAGQLLYMLLLISSCH